jgi:hypothetical protein
MHSPKLQMHQLHFLIWRVHHKAEYWTAHAPGILGAAAVTAIAATAAPTAASPPTALEKDFPGWRVWASRPRGLLWATRLGNVHYNDAPRRPAGWSITIGPAQTPGELRALLAEQRALDAGPEPPPAPAL